MRMDVFMGVVAISWQLAGAQNESVVQCIHLFNDDEITRAKKTILPHVEQSATTLVRCIRNLTRTDSGYDFVLNISNDHCHRTLGNIEHIFQSRPLENHSNNRTNIEIKFHCFQQERTQCDYYPHDYGWTTYYTINIYEIFMQMQIVCVPKIEGSEEMEASINVMSSVRNETEAAQNATVADDPTNNTNPISSVSEVYCTQLDGVYLAVSSKAFALILLLCAIALATLFFTFGFFVSRRYVAIHKTIASSNEAVPPSPPLHGCAATVTDGGVKTAQPEIDFFSMVANLFRRPLQAGETTRTAIPRDATGEQRVHAENEAQLAAETLIQPPVTATENVPAERKKGSDDEDINTYSDVNVLKESVAVAPGVGLGGKLMSTYAAEGAAPTTVLTVQQ